MHFDFAEAIEALGGQSAVTRIANEARPASDFLFATLLPERQMPTYHIDNSSMIVRATMAGLVGMDSPFPPGGIMELSSFMENTAKLANEQKLTEKALRQLQQMLQVLRDTETSITETLQREVLNFLNKLIIQPHLDVMEWLRGQALLGTIDWTFNGKNLEVDYGIPAANLFDERTIAGGDAYHLAGSTFWDDIKAARRLMRNGGIRAIIGHSDTIDEIIYNEAHDQQIVSDTTQQVTLRRWINQNNAAVAGVPSQDANDAVTLIKYDLEGEILNPADMSTTLKIPFMPLGKLLVIGNNRQTGYVVGQGATSDPDAQNELGYTHIAPTVENGGRMGRWAEIYTPQRMPMQLHGRGVTNGLPVIEAPNKIVVLSTEMPA